MFLKNAFKLFVNNINLSLKTMMYRLVVTMLSFFAIVAVCKGPLDVIVKSQSFSAFLKALQDTVHAFITGNFTETANIKECFTALVEFIGAHMSEIRLALVLVAVILFIRSYLLGICNYVVSYVLNGHMSSISRLPFLRGIIGTIARSSVFELAYTLAKTIVLAIAVAAAVLFIVYTTSFLFIFSFMIGIWIVVLAVSLFLSFTVTVRPSVVNGKKINESFNFKLDGKTSLSIFASYVFAIIIAVALNVGMLYSTLGSGLFVSLPATYVFFMAFQLAVFYSADGRKYFIDYDTIVTPKKLRNEDDKLLNEVEM